MTHKVHPKAFRIKEIADWDTRGFYGRKFPQYLEEDFKIREFLKKKLGRIGIEKIDIERSANKINVIILTVRPGLIIGRGGGGAEELKKILEKMLVNKEKFSFAKATEGKKEIKIEIREVKDPWASASLSAQFIAQQIEKRMPFRRVMKQSLGKIIAARGVEGARIELAGRLDGKEIARTEWLKKGKLPRQTIRANIDYIHDEAHCTYGRIGIKVWIYKGEKFE